MKIKNAAGVSGTLICDGTIFRVYDKSDGGFTDYNVRHSDLEITIDADYEAAFYYPENGEPYLDHAPMTLGIIGEYDDTVE